MKKIIAILLTMALIFTFAACGAGDSGEDEPLNEENSEAGGLDGGWEKAASPVITDELMELFNKAMEQLTGADYTPVAYIASQVVAGTNHMFIARTAPVVPDPVETYAIVTIYEDLEGNAELLDVADTEIETNINGLMGGWEQAESPEVTEEIIDNLAMTKSNANFIEVIKTVFR